MNIKRIGIIGLGGISTGRHMSELLKAEGCKITAICDIDETKLKTSGERLNIPEHLRFTDYHDLISCKEVDAVEICTPNYLHVPMAVAAVEAGKPINVEKPLSVNLASAEPLREALEKNPVINMMCFTYRFTPAVRYAKWIVDQGLIGDIINLDVAYLKDSAFWAERRLEWRFIKEYAGTGVLGDLGVHLIDLAELLTGKIKEVAATTEIIVKERKKLDSEELGTVETDDYCSFMANFENGAKGTFMITRCAYGQHNTIKYDVYGTKGIISFDLNHNDVLGVYYKDGPDADKGIQTVKVPEEFYLTQEQHFIHMLNGKPDALAPTVEDGLRGQRILDALEESDVKHKWVTI